MEQELLVWDHPILARDQPKGNASAIDFLTNFPSFVPAIVQILQQATTPTQLPGWLKFTLGTILFE